MISIFEKMKILGGEAKHNLRNSTCNVRAQYKYKSVVSNLFVCYIKMLQTPDSIRNQSEHDFLHWIHWECSEFYQTHPWVIHW
jgi:hypothetical protein